MGVGVDPVPRPICYAVTDCSLNSNANSGSSLVAKFTLVLTG